METYWYRLKSADGSVSHVKVLVVAQGEHFVSTSAPVDEHGREVRQAALAPKFYGITAEQAHRRMITALENSFEEVEAIELKRTPN